MAKHCIYFVSLHIQNKFISLREGVIIICNIQLLFEEDLLFDTPHEHSARLRYLSRQKITLVMYSKLFKIRENNDSTFLYTLKGHQKIVERTHY